MKAGRPELQREVVSATGHAGSSPLAAAYGLVFTVLGCVGVSAGQILFAGDRAVSASATGIVDRCALRSPLSASALGDLPDLARCTAPAYRYQGLFILGVAAVIVTAAAALTVIVPRNDLRRLRRTGKELPALPRAADRFERLCDAADLAGRRRPRLVVPGLETHESSTIAVLGQHPLIVVPAAVANAEGPGRFDAAVFHEMAHVWHGDASWVSSVRWIAVVTIPAVILACLPDLLDGGGTQVSAAVMTRAAVFAVLTVVIARWLLRRREIEADRQAARWLRSPLPLVHLLEAGLRHPPGHVRRPLRLLALHPPLQARIAALQDPADRGDGGFGYALITGVVTAMAMNASYYITWNLDIVDGGWLPARVSAAVAGALLGFALTPSLIRRAARARRAGRQAAWWRPAAGAAAGILLGSAIAPATVPGATAVALIPGLATRHAVIASLLTAYAAAGITALAAGLATLAANRPRPWWPWPGAASALAIACCTAAALWPVPGLAAGGPAERLWLMFLLPADRWRWLALSYPAVALLLMIRARPGIPASATAPESASLRAARAPGIPSLGLRSGAASVLAPVCAATAAAVLFLPRSFPPPGAPAAVVVRAAEERWWTIALAGWAVLVILALAAGVAGLARACVSAWVTCVLAAAEITAYGALTGHPGGPGAFAFSLTTPSVWLFYLAVPTSCLALLHSGITAAAARAWRLPAAATAGAAAVAILVVATGIPGLLVPPTPIPLPPPATPRPPVAPAPLRSPGPGPGQELTRAAVLRVISAAAATLPAGWIGDPPTPGSAGHVTIVPAACRPLADADYMNVLPAAAVNIAGWYRTAPQDMPTGSERFSIEVESFPSPVPLVLLAAARQERGACRQFTATGSGGPVTFTVNPPGGQAPGGHMWRVDFTVVSSGGIQAASTRIVVDIGHNLILITAQTDVSGYQPAPDQPLISGALNAAISALPHT